MPIYSYKCPEGHEFDELVPMDKRETHPCPTCSVTAKQILTPVAIDYLGMGTDAAGNPTAAAKWEKLHKQQAEYENKAYGEHGDYGKHPGA